MTRHHLRPPPQFSLRGVLAVTVIVAAVLLLFSLLPAGAQDIHHHEGASPSVDREYARAGRFARTALHVYLFHPNPQSQTRVGSLHW